VNDIDQLVSRRDTGVVALGVGIHHMFTNMVFNDLSDEAIEGTSARGRLLQDVGALLIAVDRPLDRLDLAAHSLDAIQQLDLFACDVAHASIYLWR
jgi:hypothetical protein